jgi:hypothetical protein
VRVGWLKKHLLSFSDGKHAACSTTDIVHTTSHVSRTLFTTKTHSWRPSKPEHSTHLLQSGLEALKDLLFVSTAIASSWNTPYLELNLGLGDVGLAAATAGNLLGLGDLVPDGLYYS